MKKFSYLFAVLFCLSILAASGSAPAMAATQPTDINGHWAQSQIANMVEQGVIAGYPDGTFQAGSPTSLPGTYGPATGTVTINGSVIIDTAGITLQNMIITGNLIISSSVGPGNADLKNVTVRGTTLIQSAK